MDYSPKDEYIGTVLGSLPVLGAAGSGEHFDLQVFMQKLRAAYGEIYVLSSVLESLASSGSASTLAALSRKPPPSQGRQAARGFRPASLFSSASLWSEAARLSQSIEEAHQVALEGVLLLQRAGWSVFQVDNQLYADYGIDQLFHPLDPKRSSNARAAAVVARRRKEECSSDGRPGSLIELSFVHNRSRQRLSIDGVPFSMPFPVEPFEEGLLGEQMSIMSVDMFGSLVKAALADCKISVAFRGPSAFTIAAAGKDGRPHRDVEVTLSVVDGPPDASCVSGGLTLRWRVALEMFLRARERPAEVVSAWRLLATE